MKYESNISLYLTTYIGNLLISGKCRQVFSPLNKWNNSFIFPMFPMDLLYINT